MSHYYHKDGTSCYEVPMKSDPSKMRDTNLSDARQLDLLPSVTTYLQDMIAKPFLIEWGKNNVADACVTLPDNIWDLHRHEPDKLKELIRGQEREIVEKAQKYGSVMHDQIENFYSQDADLKIDPLIEAGFERFKEWHLGEIREVVLSEYTVVGDAYAGRLDLLAYNHNGELGLYDFKTRKRGRPTTKAEKLTGLGKFATYETDIIQLGAYRKGINNTAGLPKPDFVANVFIDSNNPTPVHEHRWEPDKLERFTQCWNHLVLAWGFLKDFYPANN